MTCKANAAVLLLEQGHTIRSVEEFENFDWYIDDVKVRVDDPLYPDLIELPGCADVDVVGVIGNDEDEEVRVIKRYRARS